MPKRTVIEPTDGTANGQGQAQDQEQAPSFEEAYRELEEIVAQLERGDLPLERALDLHERGQKLAAYCAAQLDQAELRVRRLEINRED